MDHKNTLKRIVDKALTDNVLSSIRHTALNVAAEVAGDMNHDRVHHPPDVNPYIHTYYLKGGKAIELLTGHYDTGDWDFQLKPNGPVTRNRAQFRRLHHGILKMLWRCAHQHLRAMHLGPHGTREEADLNRLIAGATQDGAKFLAEIKDAYRKVFDGTVRTMTITAPAPECFVVGEAFLYKTEAEMLNSRQFNEEKDGRVKLRPNQLRTAVAAHTIGLTNEMHSNHYPNLAKPRVYVNCSIPGFILYRLALGFRVVVTGHNIPRDFLDMTFKSELVDISVPRAGTPEAHMDINDITVRQPTNWRTPPNVNRMPLPNAGDGRPHPHVHHPQVAAPGWNYHALENINILSDIYLGISASAHKKTKRMTRGAEALNELRSINHPNNNPHPAGNQLHLRQLLNQAQVRERIPWNNPHDLRPSYKTILEADLKQTHVAGLPADDMLNDLITRYFDGIFDSDAKLKGAAHPSHAEVMVPILAKLPSEHLVFPECEDLVGLVGVLSAGAKAAKVGINQYLSAASHLKWKLKDFDGTTQPVMYFQAEARFMVNQAAFDQIKAHDPKQKEAVGFGDLVLQEMKMLAHVHPSDTIALYVVRKSGHGPKGRCITRIIIQVGSSPNQAHMPAPLPHKGGHKFAPSVKFYRFASDSAKRKLSNLVERMWISGLRYPLLAMRQNLIEKFGH